MTQVAQAESKVHDIANFLFSHIDNSKISSIQDSGLYSGTFGVILFLSHYLYYFPCDKYQSIYEQYLDFCLKKLIEESQTYTYCNGLVGILNCLELMNDISLIDIDYSDIDDNYHYHLLDTMKYGIARVNYDFMHGGLGIALYYKDDEYFAKEAVNELSHSAIKEANIIKWKSFLTSNRSIGYNISLSHGMSSIIIYLAKIYKNNIMRDKVGELLYGVSNYVLSQEINYEKYGSCFPPLSLDNGESIIKSRLAWCYGDLGIAVALWQAGEVLDDLVLCSKAIEIFKYCAYRRDVNGEFIMDAGICHGSAGIAMMFNYMHWKTGEKLFLDAYNYWLSTTLDLGKFPDGFCGYKKYALNEDERFAVLRNGYDLLEGVSGIGLVLLSSVKQRLERDWSELFLLY